FSGTSGQAVSLRTSASTFPFCYTYTITILKPDGTALVSGSNPCGSSQVFIDQTALSASGTYTILLDPDVGWTGSGTLNLYSVVDVTGALTVNGGSAVPGITVPGQNARYAFSGNAGQVITLRVSNLSWNGCYGFSLTILRPDASTLSSTTACGTSGSL